jgi:hypothetical protein
MKKRYIAIAAIAVAIGGAAIAYAAIPDSKGIASSTGAVTTEPGCCE